MVAAVAQFFDVRGNVFLVSYTEHGKYEIRAFGDAKIEDLTAEDKEALSDAILALYIMNLNSVSAIQSEVEATVSSTGAIQTYNYIMNTLGTAMQGAVSSVLTGGTATVASIFEKAMLLTLKDSSLNSGSALWLLGSTMASAAATTLEQLANEGYIADFTRTEPFTVQDVREAWDVYRSTMKWLSVGLSTMRDAVGLDNSFGAIFDTLFGKTIDEIKKLFIPEPNDPAKKKLLELIKQLGDQVSALHAHTDEIFDLMNAKGYVKYRDFSQLHQTSPTHDHSYVENPPDLQFDAVRLKYSQGYPWLSYHLHNEGGSPTGVQTKVEVYLSDDMTLDASDQLLQIDWHDNIQDGEYNYMGGNVYLYPAPMGTTYYLALVADPDDQLAEAREDNNIVWLAFDRSNTGSSPLLPQQPDIVPHSLFYLPFARPAEAADNGMLPGEKIKMSFRFYNVGGSDAGAFTAKVYLSDDKVVDASDSVLLSVDVSELAAGDRHLVNLVVAQLPNDLALGQTYYLGLVADANDTINEINENNNVEWVPLPVVANTYSDPNGSPTFTSGDDVALLPDRKISWLALAGNDVITGSVVGDNVEGGDGNDWINGLDGPDRLKGDAGDDVIYGKVGNDDLSGGDGDDTIFGGVGGDVINGGTGVDYLIGNGGSDTISGGAGGDYIDGGKQNDKLHGDAGNDRIHGGDGNDVIYAGQDNDFVKGERHGDQLFGNRGNDVLYGGGGDDDIFGGNDADMLFGDGGNDYLHGGKHRDYLVGGTGDDTLYGGGHADIFRYAKGFETDRIRDFQNDKDKLDLSGWGFSDVNQALAVATQVDAHVKFDFTGLVGAGARDVLWVENITKAALANDILV